MKRRRALSYFLAVGALGLSLSSAVVAAPVESAPNIENQRTDHDPAPVLDAHDNLTQDLLPNLDSNDTAHKESLTVSADDLNDTPDDRNRVTTRIALLPTKAPVQHGGLRVTLYQAQL